MRSKHIGFFTSVFLHHYKEEKYIPSNCFNKHWISTQIEFDFKLTVMAIDIEMKRRYSRLAKMEDYFKVWLKFVFGWNWLTLAFRLR